MPEAVNPGSSGRDERPVLEQSPRPPKAPRKELHPPFFAGQVKAEEAFPHEDEILEWLEEEDDFSDMLTGIDEDEIYNEAAGPPHQVYLKKIFKLWREILCKKKFTDYRK